MNFYSVVDQAITLLRQRGRVTYRALKRQFALDDDALEDLKEELMYGQRLAADEDGRVLVWTGDMPMVTEPHASLSPSGQPSPTYEDPPFHTETPPVSPMAEAERRQLTVMFCDLVDSTALSGQLDPEDLRDIVRAYQKVCSEVITRFDGHIAQLLGDGLLVYFGYPHAHEDDAQRAIRAGLGILATMGDLSSRLRQAKGITLALRLGIHTGLVVVGAMGDAGRQEQLALGETPNIAARIQGLAVSNTMTISEVTYRLVQGYFDCEGVGAQTLRGVTEPIDVYHVLRESGATNRLDVTQARGLTPLVGRDAEVTLLQERWEQVKAGQGHVVLLTGDAGIGKSRLVHMLKDYVAHEPHVCWECRSTEYSQNSALFPLVDLFQRLLQFQAEETEEEKLDKLAQALRLYRLPVEASVPLFAPLLSLPIPEDHYPPLNLSPQRQRQKTLEALVAVLLEQTKQQPVLFIVEDLHWTDPSTLELLNLVIDQTPTASLALAQYAAVIGRQFSYDVLSTVSQLDATTLQRELGRLVEAEIVYQQGVPPQATYTFKHALIRDAAYESLLRRTRQEYHQRIAQVLAEHFPETAEAEPELLAHHYTEAGMHAQAVSYWQRAGQRASAGSAYVEAISHFTKGLVVLQGRPDTPERAQRELDLQIALGQAFTATKGQAAPEVGHTYRRARELCQQGGETPQRFRVLWGLWYFHVVRAELQTARELGEELLTLAQHLQDPMSLLGAHFTLGGALLCLGEFPLSRQQWEQHLALYNPLQHHAHVVLFGWDLGVFGRSWASHALWALGYPDQALAMSREALTLAQELSHPFSRAVALDYAAMLHQFRREPHAVHERAEAAIALCTEQGFAYYLAWGTTMQGWALVAQGQGEAGMAQLRRGLAALRATWAALRLPYYLALLAEACGQTDRAAEGLTLLAEALVHAHHTGESWTEAELHRLKGELLLQAGVQDLESGVLSLDTGLQTRDAEAEACFQQALAIARRQQAKSWELRAAMSLARLWQQQGKRAEAYALLAPIYGWFTEGFDTADLQEAKVLLEELAD